MSLKRTILSTLGRDDLKGIVDDLEIDDVDRRSADGMRSALSRSRKTKAEDLLGYLRKPELQTVCGELGLPTKGKPFVTEPMEADILDAFETLSTLLSTLGYPVFEPLVKHDTAEQFFLKGKDAEATGELVEDGFVVRAGATARKEIVPSALDSVTPMRAKLIESGVMVEENGQYRFTQDYLFNTPSGAAAVVLGRTANGWVEWKNDDGKTLNDVKRPDGEDEIE